MKTKTPQAPMKSPQVKAIGLVCVGIFFAAAGIYVGDTDDAPGAALLGILLLLGTVALAVRIARSNPLKHPGD
jgi:hypothetical protein